MHDFSIDFGLACAYESVCYWQEYRGPISIDLSFNSRDPEGSPDGDVSIPKGIVSLGDW